MLTQANRSSLWDPYEAGVTGSIRRVNPNSSRTVNPYSPLPSPIPGQAPDALYSPRTGRPRAYTASSQLDQVRITGSPNVFFFLLLKLICLHSASTSRLPHALHAYFESAATSHDRFAWPQRSSTETKVRGFNGSTESTRAGPEADTRVVEL